MRSLVLVFLFTGCATNPTIVKDRPTEVAIPVIVPCVDERPAVVKTLKENYSTAEWYNFTLKQKAELAGAQSLRRKSYGEALDAATGACP